MDCSYIHLFLLERIPTSLHAILENGLKMYVALKYISRGVISKLAKNFAMSVSVIGKDNLIAQME